MLSAWIIKISLIALILSGITSFFCSATLYISRLICFILLYIKTFLNVLLSFACRTNYMHDSWFSYTFISLNNIFRFEHCFYLLQLPSDPIFRSFFCHQFICNSFWNEPINPTNVSKHISLYLWDSLRALIGIGSLPCIFIFLFSDNHYRSDMLCTFILYICESFLTVYWAVYLMCNWFLILQNLRCN